MKGTTENSYALQEPRAPEQRDLISGAGGLGGPRREPRVCGDGSGIGECDVLWRAWGAVVVGLKEAGRKARLGGP